MSKRGAKVTCDKHDDATVTYEFDGDEEDDRPCPWCFDEYVANDTRAALARIWELLSPESQLDLPLSIRATVAQAIVQSVSDQWTIDGDEIPQSVYEADAKVARALAGTGLDLQERFGKFQETVEEAMDALTVGMRNDEEAALDAAKKLITSHPLDDDDEEPAKL